MTTTPAPTGASQPNLPQPDCGVTTARLLHELFEHQADARPQATALVCAGESLTYGEVERRANQLAHWLRQQGIGRGDCVALWLPRSLEMCVALLGILKAGAAYVPLDPEYPAERVRFILSDCQARALISRRGLFGKLSAWAGHTLLLDEHQAVLEVLPSARITAAETGVTPEDLCYVIYTSGTTGKPKGVQIEHHSVCHLVRAEAELFRVQPSDRVWQGFSIAFDASVEEVWLALFAGATLVVGTAEMVHSGPALSRTLSECGITVLSCVPTLLAMMEQDVPSLRLLILGGEVCPPDLVKRWWKPNRRVVNTYGPTEATVIATWAECRPGQPVTIGRPVPGYVACILDEHLQPVAEGVAGELCLGGPGIARGYLGRPELTREKFIQLAQNGSPPRRLYRTGDLARWTPGGELEFLGRIDGQVKIRGFRVELSEIEAVLLESPEIKAAAVTVREPLPGVQQLVGYVVPRHGALLNPQTLLARLRTRLPAYMVPALLEPLSELPTLPSGKVDRKALPAPQAATVSAAAAATGTAPRNPLEKQLAICWEKLFGRRVSVEEDFFLELGGHSLLAARMVSELRQHAEFARLSVLDVYRNPTIESLAARFSQLSPPPLAAPHSDDNKSSARIPFWRHFWCGAAQFVSLGFILTFSAMQWLTPYLTYTILVEEEYDFWTSILGAFASLVLFYPVMLLVPIIVKWLLIGRYRPGAYPLWGSFYFRWWLATTIEAAVPTDYLTGTPLLNVYLRLMGARIGRNVHLAANNFVAYDLLSIGDDSSVNVDSNLLGYTVEDGCLKIGRVTLGKRCFVGARSTLRENTVMEDNSALENLSYLPPGATLPRGETWQGSPAAPARTGKGLGAEPAAASGRTAVSRPGFVRRLLFSILHGIGLLIFPVLVVAALFPGIVVMNKLNYIDPYYWYLFLAPLVGVSFILLLALEIAAVKWLLLGKVQPGRHSLYSFYYLRKWFVDQTMDLSLDILGPLYASIYLAPWYKLLGAKLGRGAEVSTASFISPDLLSIGADSFIADSVSLGAPRVRDGVVTVGRNHIGRRSFIGNSAMLPPETTVGDSVLIGCLSAPPANPQDALREDTAWLGSPSFLLPQRQKSTAFSEETTFNPPAKLRAMRAFIEFVRVITPSTLFIVLISLLFSALLLLHDFYSLPQTLLFVPVLYIGCTVAATVVTILAKWLIVWRYRAGEKPLWCSFVWRNELLNALHEHLAEPFLVGALTGTPFICWYFRLLGARIGRRVYMETTDISEFDLARIGDEATLNADCTIQTHLFEDRVMKMSTVDVGPGCKVGAGSLVLYDTHMEAGSALGDLSLLMKGETLPAGTKWQGIPARAEKSF